MVGNIWEWVNDWYDGAYYASSPTRNPQGPDDGEVRVIRGGSWASDVKYMRLTNRYFSAMDETSNDHGFRCVMDVE
jgi:formylglycine-generating enzyme required for sulfatase activity